MKEYRIKVTSAEHRRAIVGALKGLGAKEFYDGAFSEIANGGWPVVGMDNDGNIDGWASPEHYNYASLDAAIADIIRDRQAVEVNVRGVMVKASPVALIFHDTCGAPILTFAPDDFDRIAEAVRKVRGQ